jgi:hypothetical protein
MSSTATKTITIVSSIFAALFVAQLGLIYGKPEGWLRDDAGRAVAKDFVNFYSAGTLVADGHPAAPYDWDAHRAAQKAVIGEHNTLFFPWPYPPTFLPVAELLTVLPYTASFIGFTCLSFLLAAAVVVRITRTLWSALWLAGFAATLWNFYAGQNGLLAAALGGAGMSLLATHPVLSGVAFGLLSFKPHLGLLVPLALAAGGYWRTFSAATLTLAAMSLATITLYGVEPWLAFADQLARISNAGLAEAYGKAYKFQSMFGLMRAAGLDPQIAIWIHVLAALAVAAGVTLLWRSKAALEIKCAGLAVAMLMTSPYVYIYDMGLLAIAAAFLIRHLLATATLPDQLRNTLIGLLAVNLLVYAFPFVAIPSGFAACLVMAAFVCMNIEREPSVMAGQSRPVTA